MISITKNQARVVEFLVRNFNEKNSINQIGRRLSLSPRGIYKILKNLEGQGIIVPQKIGNGIFYGIDFDRETGIKTAELVLVQKEMNNYAKAQADDLIPLKEIALSCILFGSVISKGREAGDVDIMLIIKDKSYKDVHDKLLEIGKLKPKKIHDLTLTKEDFYNGVKKKDAVILNALRTGEVLWGSEIVVEAIKNGAD